MSFQAYLRTIRLKTGKSPEDFRSLAEARRLTGYTDTLAWLKTEHGLGHGHANAIAQLLCHPERFQAGADARLAALFDGGRAVWAPLARRMIDGVEALGPDASAAANRTYVNLLRGRRKFGILQPTASRLLLGLKLPEEEVLAPYEPAGRWNTMVTHRLAIGEEAQLDATVWDGIALAYARAG